MIGEDLVAERVAIDSYCDMINFMGIGDSTTRRMLEGILAMEEEHAVEEILKAAKRICADFIVVGSKGLTGPRRFLLGSVAHKVARHAPCSVIVVRQAVPDEKSQPGCEKYKFPLKPLRKRHQ
jgi:hypothetical protein